MKLKLNCRYAWLLYYKVHIIAYSLLFVSVEENREAKNTFNMLVDLAREEGL
jgi:hypothetical protein